jgi:hypothetical protein
MSRSRSQSEGLPDACHLRWQTHIPWANEGRTLNSKKRGAILVALSFASHLFRHPSGWLSFFRDVLFLKLKEKEEKQ